MKKIVFTFLTFLLISVPLFGQYIYSTDADSLFHRFEEISPDTALVNKSNPQKPLWVPVVEGISLNLALGGFNYLMGSEFAKIGPATISHNFERGWSTDADGFITNMFAHPFHGSIYHNLARSSGYNYWVSLGVAAIGSWQWEFFMENEPPAFNDWIMTSYGGSIIGEVFYNLSSLIIDESTVGSERFWRELGAGIFNPGRLFNRLITGRTSRVTNKKLYKKEAFMGEIAFGGNNVAEGVNFKNGEKNPMLTLDFIYGRIFKKTTLKPFDFFRITSAINFSKQPIIGQLRITNIFTAKTKKYSNGSKFLYGVWGNYDYLNNNVYEIGGVSVGVGLGYSTSKNSKVQFVTLMNTGPILMGGANSEYALNSDVEFLDSARTYNMGPGAMLKSESFIRFPFGSIFIGYYFWWVHTWDGAAGNEFIGMLTPKIRFRIYDNWFLGLEYLLYHRNGVYNLFDDVNLRNNEVRVFVGLAF